MKFKSLFSTFIYALLIALIGISSMAFIACSGNNAIHQENGFEQTDTVLASVSKLKLLAELDIKIKETSGLTLSGDHLITHNDKGRANQLIIIKAEDAKILQMITVNNVQNNDWEDLARNDEFLFIGDMGNNEGERKNLAIHLIPIKSVNVNTRVLEAAGSINFNYPDQKEFEVSKKHNFDCEAILYFNNQIYLFTKNRLDDNTNLYSLPAKPGNYTATFIGTFETGGRITGADMSPDGKKIALLGYNKKSDCFLWTFEEFTGDDFFKGKSKKYTLGPYEKLGQMEGITFKNNASVYLSSEEIVNVHARLYTFDLDQ